MAPTASWRKTSDPATLGLPSQDECWVELQPPDSHKCCFGASRPPLLNILLDTIVRISFPLLFLKQHQLKELLLIVESQHAENETSQYCTLSNDNEPVREVR